MRTTSILRPAIPITSNAFSYRKAIETNISETFARVRAQMAAEAAEQQAQTRRERRRKPRSTQVPATAAPSLPLFELDPNGTIPC